MDSSFVIVGLSSQTATRDVRERFWMDEVRRAELSALLAHAEGITEAMLLVTSARTEFLVCASDPSNAANSVLRLLSQRFSLKLCEWEHFYRVVDGAAIAHVFAFATGSRATADAEEKDPENQLKSAWNQAQAVGSTGRMLDALVTKALSLAEHVRSQPVTANLEDLIIQESRAFQNKLIAEKVLPGAIALRMRVEEICRTELDSFEQVIGPLKDAQHAAAFEFKVRLTKRIANEVGRYLRDFHPEPNEQELAESAHRMARLVRARDAVSRSEN